MKDVQAQTPSGKDRHSGVDTRSDEEQVDRRTAVEQATTIET
jgi:hypothetical protein